MRAFLVVIILASGFYGQSIAESQTIIAVDVGHSIKTFGALSASGIPEYNYNLVLAKEIARKISLNQMGTFLIGGDGKINNLRERVNIAGSLGATLLLSVHHDSVQSKYLRSYDLDGKRFSYCDDFSGYSLFVSRLNKDFDSSLKCASLIGFELRKSGFHPTLHHAEKIPGENKEWADKENGVYVYDNLVVLKNVQCPAVLLEAGIIVNRSEGKSLMLEGTRELISEAVLQGLKAYILETK